MLGTVVVELALRDPGQVRYAARDLAASGRVGRLEWSTEPFRVEGTSEEASVTGLRLTTKADRNGAAARAAAQEGGADAPPAPAGAAPSATTSAAASASPGATTPSATASATPPAPAAEARGAAPTPARRPPPTSGTLTVDGRVPFAEGRAYDLTLKGDFTLGALEALVPGSQATGRASVEAHVGGTFDAPDLGGTFGLVDGVARVGGVRLSQAQVKGRFQGREALVEQASVRVLGGTVAATGSLPLAKLEAGRTARLHVEATDVDLSRFAVPASQRAADSPSFLVSVSGDLEATAPALAGLVGSGQFTRVESKTDEGTFALASPAAWRLADGRFVQEPLRLTGPLGTLEAKAEIVLAGGTPGRLRELRRSLRPAPREPVRARHHALRAREDRPPGEVGRLGRAGGRGLLRGGRARDPRDPGLHRLAGEGRGALPGRPRGDRRERRTRATARSSRTAA